MRGLSDDEELRRKYGADVLILRTAPTPSQIQEKNSRLELAAKTFGVQEWMWKTKSGRLIGVFVFITAAGGAYEFWQPKLTVAYEYAKPYIAMVNEASLKLSNELIMFGDPNVAGDRLYDRLDSPIAFVVPRTRIDPAPIEPATTAYFDRTLWRITRTSYQPVAANLLGGRWNSPDTPPVLYTAEDVLGALDEVLSGNPSIIPQQFVLHELAVRGTLESVAQELAVSMDTAASQAYGDDWLAGGRTSALAVPSIIDPSRRHFMLSLTDPGLEIIVKRSIEVVVPC